MTQAIEDRRWTAVGVAVVMATLCSMGVAAEPMDAARADNPARVTSNPSSPERQDDSETQGTFREVLATAGVGPERLAAFEQFSAPWTARQRDAAAEVLHVLGSFSPVQLDRWTAPENSQAADAKPGSLLWVTGVATACEARGPYFACRVETTDDRDGELMVLTAQVPAAWNVAAKTWSGRQPVRIRAACLGSIRLDGQQLPLLLAERLQWYPVEQAAAGWIALSHAGMDVALLDEIRQRQPLVAAHVSREAEAFYAMLSAAARYDPQQLTDEAKEVVADRAASWQRVADKTAGLLADETAEQTADERRALQRRRAIAEAALSRGAAGFSAVAPLFLLPNTEVGRLVVIEGIARRAVPVQIEPDAAARGLERYYEVEVFTPDSQHLPVICCVAKLPPHFPMGDAIRQPVRVPGFFFKLWAYRSREAEDKEKGERDAVAPLVIGPAPLWTPAPAGASSGRLGLWGGAAFVAALGILWWLLRRQSAADRAARRRYRTGQAKQSLEAIELPPRE